MATSTFVIDVTTDSFADSVIEQSRTVPVLVDFWAAWCAPCRALGPILEKLAEEYAGGFVLAKIDTEREQSLGAQYQIRSIPTVMLFRDGKSVAQFQGALPEGRIRQFLTEHRVDTGGTADQWSENPAERVPQLRAALAANPARTSLQLELAVALLGLPAEEAGGEAGILLEALPPALYQDPRAVRARARLALRRQIAGAPAREALATRLAADANDEVAQLQLGVRELLDGEAPAGLDRLLALLREQKTQEASPARAALLEAFQLLEDETLVRDARRRMAALLF